MLLTLLGGVFSAGIDLLEDHSAPRVQSSSHSEKGSRPSHLIRHHAEKGSRCNVCYFHKLLGHWLCPAQGTTEQPRTSAPRTSASLELVYDAELELEFTRGPPRS